MDGVVCVWIWLNKSLFNQVQEKRFDIIFVVECNGGTVSI
jgi:hypothetical protein